METSLIGKALNFGFNDYGFESRVSKMLYNNNFLYFTNLINMTKARRFLYIDVILTKRTIVYIKLFSKLAYIESYEIRITNNDTFKKARIYLNYNNSDVIGKDFKIISKPSHRLSVKLRSLRLLAKKTGSSTCILSTSSGIINHRYAIKKKIGGLMLSSFSI